ncbi:alpha/beta fold hydrolase [Orrella daihaiensis]|uniref:Alpha/beta hydrolase n=1 Tax=Orrella daihaiensis TaxID=2782176 RepID=A0ABY4AQW5_9BURK|nr:alpha/beta hydrolase [Orrella daihaiensis]UOD51445.1 alpha/beta hydrolase [Orrella daihaiensis]
MNTPTQQTPTELMPLPLDYEVCGQGPALLLLHGFPQNRAIWQPIKAALSPHFTLVMPDLRGYGQSPKPASDPAHLTYSKRAMANDLIKLMDELGHVRFGVVGHDRGARVAHRLAADHGERISRLMLLDISPTLAMYEQTDMTFAAGYWHWFFLIQAYPLPETMIGQDPVFFMDQFMVKRYPGRHIFESKRWESYLAGIQDPACLHAMCEDYRASFTIDLEHDRADRQAQRKLQMPVRVLWGQHGMIEKCFKPLEDWAQVASDVSGQTIDAGHYIPEERPEMLQAEIRAFFS